MISLTKKQCGNTETKLMSNKQISEKLYILLQLGIKATCVLFCKDATPF